MNRPIFVSGIPRSGSTWLAKVLCSGGDLKYIHEPDNERHTYSAYYYKQNLPRFPFLREKDEDSRKIKKLFNHAFYHSYFGMGSFSNKVLFKLSNFDKEIIEVNLKEKGIIPKNLFRNVRWLYHFLPKEVQSNDARLVKSVHSILSLEYILKEFNVSPVIIIRHPASIVSSCIELDNPDIDRKIYTNKSLMNYLFGDDLPDWSELKSIESLAGFQVAIFYKLIYKMRQENDNILLVQHEDLAEFPLEKFQSLFDKLNLTFNDTVINFINKNNKKGDGYDINRVSNETIDVWKSRLNDQQIQDIAKGYNLFPSSYYKNFK